MNDARDLLLGRALLLQFGELDPDSLGYHVASTIVHLLAAREDTFRSS
jgi:hypothetical protein